jgi:pimeloyl-ACP methyl ester carboxylesterase
VFEGMEELEHVDIPALVVASRDEADPSHPFAVAEAWAERLPRGRLVTEDEGKSPLAWQGARLSKAIAEFLDER